ncbi:related to ankyrin repeat-containing YAR1 [Cephalotrichum gorgonifer]|uniref:Related to ankyrin repeat-containing YAR1 n=1 Tax=Cephalotrichum gorgonifer TaxID=2041049 RepID=A0AAE8SYP5_9PEZI|nr:related to ankyrin repeat-containing YAR1 [Cephalotrichum gorgonifer]
MAPKLTEEETDDLLYLARTGETSELEGDIATLSAREGVSAAEVLSAARDEGKSTCLHMATGNGHLETVRLLLSYFTTSPDLKIPFLDAANEFGNTALHWAALGGHLDTVILLVEAGAAQGAANQGDYVPLDLALSRGHQAVVDYFFKVSGMKEGENAAGGALEGAVEGVEIDGEEASGEEDKAEEKGEGSKAQEKASEEAKAS